MATLKKHGDYIIIELIPYKKAYCEDGTIMHNYGNGWKIKGKIKKGFSYTEAAEYQKKFTQELLRDKPAFRKWYELIMQYPLEGRHTIRMALDMLGDDVDGIWSELRENPFGHKSVRNISLQEVIDLYEARNLLKSEA